jgi:hypothetical protein
MRSPALALASLIVLVGCSSSSGNLFGATGGTTTGGSGGGTTTTGGGGGARAALALEVYAQPEQSCPAGDVHLTVGDPTASTPVLVADGEGGAHVACTIAVEGEKYVVSGTVTSGTTTFHVDGFETTGKSAVANVTVTDPASGTSYQSTKSRPCLFQFAENDGQGVDPKHVFVGFDCAELVSASDKGKACSSRYGTLRFEGCSAH